MRNKVLIALIMGAGFWGHAKNYNVSDYGLNENSQTNATEVVSKIMSEIKKSGDKSAKIIFNNGDYHFRATPEMKRELYISNHDQDNPKNVGIAVEGVENLVIDGNGANFLFHGRMLPLAIKDSKNCSFKNFSIDFPNPHIAQVQVVGYDQEDKSTLFEVAPWVNFRIEDGKFITYGDNWQMHCTAGIAFDEKTRRIVYRTSDLYTGGYTTKISDRRVKIKNDLGARLNKGTIVAMRSWYRPTPGIFLSHSKNTIFKKVNVHYAEGMGLLAQLSDNIKLDGFSVCLRGDEDPRYFTTQADATHFSSCKGNISATNGLYEGMMDDAINVHGTYLKVIKQLDEKTLIGRYMHGQTWGFDWGFAGDEVQFVKSETMELVGNKNKIVSISASDRKDVHGAREFRIEFAKPLGKELDVASEIGIENLEWTCSVTFSNNLIRNNRARGTLFSTPKRVVVENNLFDHTSGTAILLCGDCKGWFETGACKEVIIRRNKFINSLSSMFQFTNAIISIYPEISNLKDQRKYFHSGVIIEENDFITFDKPLLYAKSIDGLIFRKNVVKYNNAMEAFHWNKHAFFFERVKNVIIENNVGIKSENFIRKELCEDRAIKVK